MGAIIAVDIGGSSTALALLDKDLNFLHRSEIIRTASMTSGDHLVQTLLQAKDEAVKTAGLTDSDIIGVGVGCPGPLNASTGVILNTPNITYLHDFPLRSRLQNSFDCPVVLDNDANLFALGEAIKGAGQGNPFVVGITLGSGFGFGIVINGKVHRGATGSAAEYGLSAWRVNSETWEDTVSIKGVVDSYRAKGGSAETPLDVFDKAQAGDAAACDVWQRYGTVLGLAISHVVNLIDPNVIVFGGEMRGAWSQFSETMESTIHKHIFDVPAAQLQLLTSTLGVDATLYGAAQFALNSL